MITLEDISDQDIFRYLGYPPDTTPDSLTCNRINQAKAQLMSAARPRSIARIFPREQVETLLRGHDILTHLVGCQMCLLMAATLGSQTDQLLRSASIEDMEEALMLDAAASVMVDAVAQQVEDQWRIQQKQEKAYVTTRFSPGYGDLPIGIQGEMLSFLDAGRTIGLYATSTHILTPRKSITAICGVSTQPVSGKLAGCDQCKIQSHCLYVKEGKTCGKGTV